MEVALIKTLRVYVYIVSGDARNPPSRVQVISAIRLLGLDVGCDSRHTLLLQI